MTEAHPESTIGGTDLIVGDRPMVFWEYSGSSTQLDFLTNIDTSYFIYQLEAHRPHLGGEYDRRAAVALRVTYAHAMETLFALIGASVQAPACPAGWMLKYQTVDLSTIVERITKAELIPNRLGLQRGDWAEVVDRLHAWTSANSQPDQTRRATERFWRLLAKEFLDEHLQDEYNSLKHGLRARSTEWFLAMGREDTPGVPAPAGRMRTVAQSQYGSTFYRAHRLKKYQWEYEIQRVNWDAEGIALRLPVLVHTMDNVLAFLKQVNGASAADEVWWIDPASVERVIEQAHSASAIKFSVNRRIDPEAIPDLSREAIAATYDAESQGAP